MAEAEKIRELEAEIQRLETRIKHLANDLELTRQEKKDSMEKYFDLYSNMEKNVQERTEQLKELQSVLKIKNLQLEIMVDSAPGMIFYKDIHEKYIRVNKKLAELYGCDVREFIGRRHTEIFPADADNLMASDKTVLQTREPVLNQTVFVKTHRGERCLLVSKVPYKDIDGNIIGIIGFALDTTENYHAEKERDALREKLAQAEKMEAIGTLAGGVAHDLNNILTGIVSYPDLVMMELDDDSHLRRPLLTIQEGGLKAAAIVQDMLTLARRGFVRPALFDLNAIVQEYFKTSEFRKFKTGFPTIGVYTQTDQNLLPVKCSPSHLAKAVGNLVAFAIEAVPEKSEIHLKTQNGYVDVPFIGFEHIPEGDYVIFQISCPKLAIKDDDLEHIFEPFYTKKNMGITGTGLGLAVVWGVIKDHAGYIDVKSDVEKGTVFELYIPASQSETMEMATMQETGQLYGHGESVLVVDDMEKQREIASGILEKLNYHVYLAGSGEEAVEFVRQQPVDLVVLDMIMEPGIDGLETFKRILQIRPGQKAVITSGFAETDRVLEAQQLGAGAFIRKPYLIETFGHAIYKELQKP